MRQIALVWSGVLLAVLVCSRNCAASDAQHPQWRRQEAKTDTNTAGSDHDHDHDHDSHGTKSPPRVLIIGFGPSGMSFCHALETKREEYQRNGQYDKLAELPIVTAFEKESSHGGVWRQDKTNPETKGTSNAADAANESPSSPPSSSSSSSEPPPMYEGMWCNGVKEGLEYFDYTFQQHFKCPLPPYIQRGPILDYITARVTQYTPAFFDKYVTFNTEVSFVSYNDTNPHNAYFNATMKHTLTNHIFHSIYDKVIWAGGLNTKAYIPTNLKQTLQDYKGTLLHSSQVGQLKDSIHGKNILVIGGSYSAEDITLTAIKLGAKKIYISSRKEENVISSTSKWPLGKVEYLNETIVYNVDENNCIMLDKYDYYRENEKDELAFKKEWDMEFAKEESNTHNNTTATTTATTTTTTTTTTTCTSSQETCDAETSTTSKSNHQDKMDSENEQDMVKLCNIDIIVLCTGYDERTYYHTLDEKIVQNRTLYEDATEQLKFPTDWKMNNNYVSDYIQNVDLSPDYAEKYFSNRNVLYYHMIPRHNPNMIYLLPDFLLWADVMAWLALSFVTGENPIPSLDEMTEWILNRMNDEMQVPPLRYNYDSNYRDTVDVHEKEIFGDEDDLKWFESDSGEWYVDIGEYDLKVLADMMEVANYPVNIGSFHELNEVGQMYNTMNLNDRDYTLGGEAYGDKVTKKTFRDLGQDNLQHIRSVYSGQQSVGFKELWLDINDFDDIWSLCGNDTVNQS